MPAAQQKKKVTPSSKPLKKIVIDYSKPANDGVFDGAAFEKFLHDRFKVDGRPGQLGDSVKIVKNGNTIIVTYYVPIAKTYLKYLTKKYLKKNELRDWIRVVAPSKDKYELRFYNVEKEDDEED
ncbi:hypothetical protein M407DRAFT_121627 [Tulasnella calospora MUT 4182]|uniref:Ribosomal protein L22e n=1 Tax=Tulasnella calospora MUT 4182 TaxID=1051891 RepID=A0A0C3QSF9_9AGAM|nr:hypothetical protein M407DRAFT_121627 [Tulasnella calospora MUT 4182]